MRPYFAGNTNENAYASSAINFRQSSDYENCSKRRFRTNFTENQSLVLEEAFQESHYPDQSAKRAMSLLLDIPEDRITVWFQNRRAKWRRKEVRERERKTTDYALLNKSTPASQAAAPQRHFEPFSQQTTLLSHQVPPSAHDAQTAYSHFDNDFSRHYHY